MVKGGTRQYADLTTITGAPVSVGTDAGRGYAWEAGPSKQVLFGGGVNHHIHELSVVKGGTWQYADLTAITGAPPKSRSLSEVSGNGYTWEAGQSKQVIFRADDGHIHELFVIKGGAWQHADLTAITGAPVVHQPLGLFHGYSWETGQSKQVVYGTNACPIHELSVIKGGAWQFADLAAITGAPCIE